MNIAFFTATYKPTINGVVSHIVSVTEELKKMGHQVTIIAPKFPKYTDDEPNIVRYTSLPNPKVNNYPIPFPLIEFISKMEDYKFDIVHAHHPFQVGLLAKIVAESQGVPLVYTNHTQLDDYAEIYSPKLIRKVTKKVVKKVVSHFANSCDLVISPSKLTRKKLIEEFGFRQVPVKTIYNGVNTQIFHHITATNVKEELSIPKSSKVLIYVGRIDKGKNLEKLINIINRLNNPQLYLLLIGEGGLKSKLQKLSSNNPRILFLGNKKQKELPRYLSISDYFISLSVSEVMPVSFLEALSCGIPIIAADDIGTREIVQENYNGFLMPETDTDKTLDKLRNIINKLPNSEYQQLRHNAKKSSQKFTIKQTATELIKIHQELSRHYANRK